MKKLLIALFGVVVLNSGTIPVGNGVPRAYNYAIICVDGYKFYTTSFGYASISTVQIYEPSHPANYPPHPAACKEKE